MTGERNGPMSVAGALVQPEQPVRGRATACKCSGAAGEGGAAKGWKNYEMACVLDGFVSGWMAPHS